MYRKYGDTHVEVLARSRFLCVWKPRKIRLTIRLSSWRDWIIALTIRKFRAEVGVNIYD